MDVLIRMDLKEYARRIADKICKEFCEGSTICYEQIVDIVVDIFGYSNDVEVEPVENIAGNLWFNSGGLFFSSEEITDGLFSCDDMDIEKLLTDLKIKVDFSKSESPEEVYKKAFIHYLDTTKNFYELNEWLINNYPHGVFKVIYSDSRQVCGYFDV